MKQIRLKVIKSNVYDEVAKTTSYTGSKMQEDPGAFDRIFTTDEDRLMLERFWNEACSESTERLKKFVSSVSVHLHGNNVELAWNYDVVLHLSDRFDDVLTDSINCSLFSFFVSYIVAKWYGFTNKGEYASYISEAEKAIEDISRKLHYKNRPSRKKPTKRFSVEKIDDYLFLADYDNIDYDFAGNYFLNKNNIQNLGLCSSLRSGEWYGRNLDWFFNRNAEFIVRTKNTSGRNAVLGVSGGINELSSNFVETGIYTDIYKIVPFFLLDGINEYGLFCNTNVVPADKGITTLTIPNIKELSRLCTVMVPRFVLDHFRTAESAVRYLMDYCALYAPKSIQSMGYEAHFMIGDAYKTFVVEIVDNVIVAHEHSVMTNFFIDGVKFNEDGKVYTPYDVTQDLLPSQENGITPYGSGLERYNTIISMLSAYNGNMSKARMRDILLQVIYTNTYKKTDESTWFTEFVTSKLGLTVDTPWNAEEWNVTIEKYREIFKHRSRDIPNTWHTSHSSIYNIAEKKLYLCAQEKQTEYVFTLTP